MFVCTAVLFAAKSQKFKDKLIEKMDKYDPVRKQEKKKNLSKICAIIFLKREIGKPNGLFFFLKDATEGDAKKATTAWDKGQKVVRINRHFKKNNSGKLSMFVSSSFFSVHLLRGGVLH